MALLSVEFVVFVLVCLTVYYLFLPKKQQVVNWLLSFFNLFFYSTFGLGGIFILLIISAISFLCGHWIGATKIEKERRIPFYFALISLLSILIFYKYVPLKFTPIFLYPTLEAQTYTLIMPIGLSFYTFQSIGYLIDIFWGKYEPESKFINYFAFGGFFATILSGPILRFDYFRDKLQEVKKIDRKLFVEGLRNILIGVFKKVVIANFIASTTTPMLTAPENYGSVALLLTLFLYSIQIYSDFSGYSDMAIGIANLFGIKIPANFRLPYFSQNFSEFWRRWHISLSSWLNEYLFSPLSHSFRALGRIGIALAVIATFVICGLWHGNTLNFAIWGMLNGLLILPAIFKRNSSNQKIIKVINILLNFFLVSMVWSVFYFSNINDLVVYYSKIFTNTSEITGFGPTLKALGVGSLFIFVDYIYETRFFLRSFRIKIRKFNFKINFRYIVYYTLIIFILYSLGTSNTDFIYFQF